MGVRLGFEPADILAAILLIALGAAAAHQPPRQGVTRLLGILHEEYCNSPRS